VDSKRARPLFIGRDPSPFIKNARGDLVERHRHYAGQFGSISVLTVNGGGLGTKRAGSGGIIVTGVPGNPLLYLVIGFLEGRAEIKKRGINVMEAQDSYLCGWLAFLLASYSRFRGRRMGLVLDVHADTIDNPYWNRERLENPILNYFAKILLRKADCVRVVSPGLVEKIAGFGVRRERIVFLPVGTDLEKIKGAGKGRARKEGGILFVGRLVKQKNIELLLKAFASLLKKHPGCKLTIVGDGPDREKLEKMRDGLGLGAGVSFTGLASPERLEKEYAENAFLVLPSFYEGWGLVIMEAFANGMPVVVSGAVSTVNPAVVDMETAFVFKDNDADSLCEKMEKMLALEPSERAKMAAKAMGIIREFDIRKTSERLKEMMDRVAGDAGG